MTQDPSGLTVAAFYKFAALDDFASYRAPLLAACGQARCCGTVLLAHEGVNGTIAGTASGVAGVLDHIRAIHGCGDLDVKYSTAHSNPFYRMKVRLKREIVTMGVSDIDPAASAGRYVEPDDWNELISDPDVVVIDTRNDYEVSIGTFENAVNPHTASFTEFPGWFEARAGDFKATKVAMFCTGGIRCEKSTAYARKLGFTDVFHLKGGILNYLEKVPEADSRWHGECFVFDQRVSVGHGLAEGNYDMCHACRLPLDEAARQSSDYAAGVSCPHCIDQRSDRQRSRYRERQSQIERAGARGSSHLGTATQAGSTDT